MYPKYMQIRGKFIEAMAVSNTSSAECGVICHIFRTGQNWTVVFLFRKRELLLNYENRELNTINLQKRERTGKEYGC